MWGKIKELSRGRGIVASDPATDWRIGIEKAEAQSLWYQAKLFHAWKALREHQKGMQRQARRMKRLRTQNAELKVLVDWYRSEIKVPPDFVDEKDLELASSCEHPPAFQKTVTTNAGTVTICETCSESRFTPWPVTIGQLP